MAWENLTDEEREAIISGPLPLSLHPHYPFVFIDLILKRETPPLFTFWVLRPDLRSQIVTRWCALAKTRYWAWDQCRDLREHLISFNEPIPKPLRQLARHRRPRHQGAPEKLADDFVLDEIARLLEKEGFTRTEAELAIALSLASDPSLDSTVESRTRTVRRARARVRAEMSKTRSP